MCSCLIPVSNCCLQELQKWALPSKVKVCRDQELPVKEANFDQLFSNVLHSNIGLGNQPDALPATSYSRANKGSNNRGLPSPRRSLNDCNTGGICVGEHVMYTFMLRVIELRGSDLRDLIRGLKGFRPGKGIPRAPDVLLEGALKEIRLALQSPEDMQCLLLLSHSAPVPADGDDRKDSLALEADSVSFENSVTTDDFATRAPGDDVLGAVLVLESDDDLLHRDESTIAPHHAEVLTRFFMILV